MYASLTTDNLVPLPDYAQYQDQAKELDVLSDRIDGLIDALRVRGVYDGAVPELARLFSEGDNNKLIGVTNWAAFAEKQGLKGAIDILDITPIANALNEAYKAMEQVKGQIYEITGMSDIIRGDTDANETLGAQKLKTTYGNLRLKSIQEDAIRFATDLLKIKSQIICNFYSPEALLKIASVDQFNEADQQYIMPAVQLLKDKSTVGFRIDIETDSMVQLDENQVKQDRVEFLGAVGNFMKEGSEVAMSNPTAVPMMMEMLKFGVSAFKAGKNLEGVIDEAAEQMKQAAAQAQANPPPNPEMIKAQAQQQSDQMKMQMQAQISQQEIQAKMQSDQQMAQIQAQLDQHKQELQAQQVAQQNQIEAQRDMQKIQLEAESESRKQAFEHQMAESKLEFERWRVQLEADTKIAVAELAANTSLQTTAMSSSNDNETMKPDGTKSPNNTLQALVDASNGNFKDLIDAFTQSHTNLIETMNKPVKKNSDGSWERVTKQ